MIRRVSAALVAAAALLLVSTATASSQDALPPGWGSSSATVNGTTVSGAMQRDGAYWDWGQLRNRPYLVGVSLSVARPAGVPAECAVPSVSDPGTSETRRPFSHTLVFECNGAYPVTVVGTANQDGGTATLVRTVQVSMPAPAVSGVTAELEGDSVRVTWDDMTSQAKDLTGYRIERRVDSGEFELVREVGIEGRPTSTVDDELPADGEIFTYRVVAVRAGTTQSETGEASEAAITRAGAPVPPPGSTDGGGGGTGAPGGSDDPSVGTPSGADGAAGPSGGGGRSGRPGGGRVVTPRLGITGTFLPPLLQPKVPTVKAAATPTTIDPGYEDELPYEPGATDADEPDDELASVLLGEASGRGMAVPVATALVLAVWAIHLRVLARASRPS